MKWSLLLALSGAVALACQADVTQDTEATDAYLDYSSRTDVLSGGARYDTMDPAHMEWMARQFPDGCYLY